MKINRENLDWALAVRCMAASDLRRIGLSSATIARIRKGCDVSPKTAGRLARALDTPLERLVNVGGDGITPVIISLPALAVTAAEQGLTLPEATKRAGVSSADAKAVMRNEPIAASTAWRIADVLCVPLAQLIEREG